jgi:hypothetical protein
MLTALVARHKPESAAAVLLSKWLGDIDMMASMVGSESMTSTDWMLLALSNMGQGSQKKVGEAFVQRLLEKGDIHPAVAIFLGLGEHNDAIEVYVSRQYYLEAVLLTCLLYPTDWQRQSFLVRKWGEYSVSHGKAELAVRCFSCMGLETTEPWFSPRAQDAVYAAQQQAFMGSQMSPPLSPPSVGSSRVIARMASLKLVTDFNRGPLPQQIHNPNDDLTPMNPGVTPIAESALTPSGARHPWKSARDGSREPTSARTATPGAYRRHRMPSRSDAARTTTTNNEVLASLAIPDRGQRSDIHPRTAIDNIGRESETLPFSTRRATTTLEHNDLLLSATTFTPGKTKDHLPSPAVGVFETFSQKSLQRQRSESRGGSRSRKPLDLQLDMSDIVIEQDPATGHSLPLTGASMKSAKVRSIDQYISSLDEANNYNRNRTDPVEERPASRTARARSRPRDESQSRGRSGVRYIRSAKRSPSSPVPMSPEDAGIYATSQKEADTNTESFDDERFYKMNVASPVATESVASTRTARSRARHASKPRASSKAVRRAESPEAPIGLRSRATSRATSRRPAEDRGRSANRGDNSPVSPQPMYREDNNSTTDYEPVRARQRSVSRRPRESAASTRREPSTERRATRDRSVSQRPTPALRESSRTRANVREHSPDSMISGRSETSRLRPATMSRREIAAKELADRRLSLARRPSAPAIPDPGEFLHRPIHHGRSNTDDTLSPLSFRDPIQRSHTADPEMHKKYSPTNRMTGATSTVSVPIGLPANPRAMRHPRYMSADPNDEDDIPAVPAIPENLQYMQEPKDSLGPLLPATTFGQPITPLIRSATAPPQDLYSPKVGLRQSPTFPLIGRRPSIGSSRGHARQSTLPELLPPTNYKRISPPPVTATIAETIHEADLIIVEAKDIAPPVLSQLQHLATPPPPPPAPLNIGMINIAIDENSDGKSSDVQPSNTSGTSSPRSHRRGRNSVSDNLGMTFRKVADRMRSTSRSGNRSPPSVRGAGHSPYESVPEHSFLRGGSQRSPPVENGKHDSYFNNMIPPPPPPPPMPMEQVIPPADTQTFYKHPKELRANMPPATLQPGVYQPGGDSTPMI